MARLTNIVTNFLGGQVSASMYGRIDLSIHAQSAKELTNFIVLPQGGIRRRDGTQFVAPVADQSKVHTLIPFIDSVDTSFVLELGNTTMRFYKAAAQIRESGVSITGATQANPVVITAGSHGYSNGDQVFIDGVVGMTELNGRWFTVANKTGNTFELTGVNGSTYTAYSSGGSSEKVYQITTPWSDTQADDVQWAHSGDALYLAHPSFSLRKLTRASDTSWTLAEVDFIDGPYLGQNKTAVTLTPAAATGSGITLTASSATFSPSDTTGTGGTGAVDRLVRILHGSTWGYAKIVAYTSTTVVTIDILSDFGGTTASTDWRLGALSTTTGFARSVTMFEQRLMLGGTTSSPNGVWGSVTGDPEDMTPGANSDSGLTFFLGGRDNSTIQWIQGLSQDLFVGTYSTTFDMNGGDTALTPTTPRVRPRTFDGSAHIMPALCHESVVFIDRSAKRIMEVDSENHINLLTWHSDDIAGDGFTRCAYQSVPVSVAWFIRSDGKLAGVTIDHERDLGNLSAGTIKPSTSTRGRIAAWHVHSTTGTFESLAVIPRGGVDELWVTTKRTVNGATARYVERFDSDYNTDCGTIYSGTAISSLVGLWELEAASLAVKADGAVIPNITVASGVLALGDSYTDVEAGLSYTSTLENLPQDVTLRSGTTAGAKRRHSQAVLRLNASLGGVVNGDEIPYRTAADNLSEAPPAFTGDKAVTIDSAWSRSGTITVTHSQPYDFELSALITLGEANQG